MALNAPPPTPPADDVPPVVPETSFASDFTQNRFTTSTRRRVSTSFWDIFDLKFEKYVTPWVVRWTWCATLAQAVIVLIVVVLGIVATSVGGSLPDSTPAADWQPKMRTKPEPPKTVTTLGVPEGMSNMLLKLFVLMSLVLWLLMSLLWVRVFLECVIVAFNISEDVKGIRDIAKSQRG